MDGVMIEGCRDGVMKELKCRDWIEMLVVSSSQDVVLVWIINRCLLCFRCGGVPRSPARRTLRPLILPSTAASVRTLQQMCQDCYLIGKHC